MKRMGYRIERERERDIEKKQGKREKLKYYYISNKYKTALYNKIYNYVYNFYANMYLNNCSN